MGAKPTYFARLYPSGTSAANPTQLNPEAHLFWESLPNARPTPPGLQSRYARLVGCRLCYQDFRQAQPAKHPSFEHSEEQTHIQCKSLFHVGSQELGRS